MLRRGSSRELADDDPRDPMTATTLLGPQRHRPTARLVLERLGVSGDVALVSAGWQEREGEVDALSEHLDRPVRDLMLYRRAERVRAEEPELARALAARQAALRDLQAVYRIRLRHAVAACEEIGRGAMAEKVRVAGWRSGLRAIRRLDREHLRSVTRLRELAGTGSDWPALGRERDEIEQALDGCAVVLIAGGHVAVLLNRLRLFAAGAWLRDRPLIGWGAGAMVLCDRIVLFHDRPPQGAGDPELLDMGLGLAPGVVALPDARHRLALDDPDRVSFLAARFAPARSLTLDEGALLRRASDGLAGEGVFELQRSGRARALAS
jgi:hypothetical protein